MKLTSHRVLHTFQYDLKEAISSLKLPRKLQKTFQIIRQLDHFGVFLKKFWLLCFSEGVISFWRARAGCETVRLARMRARADKAGLNHSAEPRMLLSSEEDGVSAPSCELLKVVSVFCGVGGLLRPRFFPCWRAMGPV